MIDNRLVLLFIVSLAKPFNLFRLLSILNYGVDPMGGGDYVFGSAVNEYLNGFVVPTLVFLLMMLILGFFGGDVSILRIGLHYIICSLLVILGVLLLGYLS